MSVNSEPDDPGEAPVGGEPSGGPAGPPAGPEPTPEPAPDATPDPAPDPRPDPTPEPRPASVAARPSPSQPAAMRRTRLGGLWMVAAFGAVILVLLLVFILQNGQRVEIHLYGAHWNAPLGVALLMAAALGVLLVVVPGGGRIIQLKRAARRLHRDRLRLAGQLDQAVAPVEPNDLPADA